MAYQLTAAAPLDQELRRCADEQLSRAITALTHELDTDPVEAIHTARKAIKKTRALLRLARGGLGARQRTAENAALRQAQARLSTVRDAEVTMQTLRSLAERYGERLPVAVVESVRRRLECERDTCRAERAAVLQSAHELLTIRRRVHTWTLSGGTWSALSPGLERTYRDARRAMRRARKQPSLEALHEWRKRVKDTWYELRLLAPVCGAIVRGAAEEAEALSEVLGEEHDLGVLACRVRGLDGQVAGLDTLTALIDERRGELRAQAQLIGRRLYAETPRAYRRRLRLLWGSGRLQFAAHPITSLRPNTRSNALSSP